jgi:peptidoglycan/xylan/chitin deacetylase (PgdA/CDA1 family)
MIDPNYYLYERYLPAQRSTRLLRAYYAAKPLMPRRLQLGLRRAYAPVQARRVFPAWPIEPLLVDRRDEELMDRIRASSDGRVPVVNFWPERRRFAVVLTHDVEGPVGVNNVMRVVDLERRHGFVSAWNFVAEWYPIPDGLFDTLRAAGCEIGLHGIRHDGRMFRSRADFDQALPPIQDYLRRWDAVGFRSPATHRNAAWMAELPALYDSSFPDTDPFEPQPGGCCSIFPFRFGRVVELPITLVQDHTLFEILRDLTIERWVTKSKWIIRHHGLINLIVHPDYVVDPKRLAVYEEFLVWLACQADAWHALPRDVARWWLAREGVSLSSDFDGVNAVGPASGFRATVAYAREDDGRVVFDV